MERKRTLLQSELFWSTYPGMTLLGIVGLAVTSVVGTAMLLFRPEIEPWIPTILNFVIRRASRETDGIAYVPAMYPWIVGYMYGAGVFWAAVLAFAAWQKPSTDRRLDAFLMKRYASDESQTRPIKGRRK